MQQQQQQQKPARKISLVVTIAVTIILFIVTGIFYLSTSLTSPNTLWSAVFTLVAIILSIGQFIFIFFPPKSQPTNVTYNEHHHHYPPQGDVQTTPASPAVASTAPTAKPIFYPNLPLQDAGEFYGREGERTRLISQITNGGSSSLVGERRMGKTWLLRYVQLIGLDLPGRHFRVGYLSATNAQCSTLAGFTLKALEVLKAPGFAPNQADVQLSQLGKAVGDLQAQGIVPVLCIDEFEGFKDRKEFDKDFVEGLRAMTQDDGLVLITASRRRLADVIVDLTGETSPLFNIVKQITLQPFTEAEAWKFISEKSIQAGFDDWERAYFMQCATMHRPNGEKFWPPLRLQLIGQMLRYDKEEAQREQRPYQVRDVRYQVDFEKRLQEEYEAVVK